MNRIRFAVSLLALALFAPACTPNNKTNQGGENHAPVQRVATPADLKAKMAGGDVLVVNTLEKKDFTSEHIPGSIHIFYKDVSAATLKRPKDAPVVFYCAGGGCPVSRMAASRAIDAGYTNVYVFEGGIKDWKAAGYDVAHGE